MHFMHDRRSSDLFVPTRSSVKPGTTVRSSPFFPSPHSAPGKTQKTNGSRKSSGIALRYFALDWPRLFSTTSKKTLMCSSKAVWSAPLTSRRMADVRLIKMRSEEHTSELQSLTNLVCRLLLEKKKTKKTNTSNADT